MVRKKGRFGQNSQLHPYGALIAYTIDMTSMGEEIEAFM
jgi:hypothetical protein